MQASGPRDGWSTRIGVILAVSGSAVGLGNFVRFPGRAALYGGGAFMIPYFISLVILGIPICWLEWTLGRQGGRYGFNSAPGLFSVVTRTRSAQFFGALAVLIPLVIYMYYVFIESWCLRYAWDYLIGNIQPGPDPNQFSSYFSTRFNRSIGAHRDGALFEGLSGGLVFLSICFVINFTLIYRGVAKGIETFCKWAMPALIVAALIVLARVLTLGTPNPAHPDQNVLNGLGFMWNPKPVGSGSTFSALADPQVWLEAAGQIFFSLSVGFGIILTYASYLRPHDDVVLSGLTASATNEFCEVCLGGLITIPAAFIFLGAAPLSQVAGSSIGLGFHAVPVVFEYLPFGRFFGFLWFGLLFLAAVTSSISMLQPAIAFLEEGFGMGRRSAMAALGLITATGALLVVYFTKNTVALDVMDFWVGSALLIVLALFEVVLFGWVLGVDRGLDEANRGSDIRIPRVFGFIIRYVCPTYLLAILGGFAYRNFPAQARAVAQRPAALLTVSFIGLVFVFLLLLVRLAVRRWEREGRFERVARARLRSDGIGRSVLLPSSSDGEDR
ncbi:MAG: sodium-dependent transporter [Candidatus Binatia bacterium]